MPSVTIKDHKIIYTVTKVTVTEDSTINKYGGEQKDLKEVQNGIKKAADWTLTFEIDKKKHKVKRINGFGYPLIDKHPGHVEGKGWKYNIDLGTGSVDRYIVKDATGTIKKQGYKQVTKGRVKMDTIDVAVEVKCSASQLEGTH